MSVVSLSLTFFTVGYLFGANVYWWQLGVTHFCFVLRLRHELLVIIMIDDEDDKMVTTRKNASKPLYQCVFRGLWVLWSQNSLKSPVCSHRSLWKSICVKSMKSPSEIHCKRCVCVCLQALSESVQCVFNWFVMKIMESSSFKFTFLFYASLPFHFYNLFQLSVLLPAYDPQHHVVVGCVPKT